MTPNPGQVIVTNEDLARASRAWIRRPPSGFPGGSRRGRLGTGRRARGWPGLLCQTLDNAPSDWRREMILAAIEDVRAFAEGARG